MSDSMKKVYKIQYLIQNFRDSYGMKYDFEWADYYKNKVFATKELTQREIDRITEKAKEESEGEQVFDIVEMELVAD